MGKQTFQVHRSSWQGHVYLGIIPTLERNHAGHLAVLKVVKQSVLTPQPAATVLTEDLKGRTSLIAAERAQHSAIMAEVDEPKVVTISDDFFTVSNEQRMQFLEAELRSHSARKTDDENWFCGVIESFKKKLSYDAATQSTDEKNVNTC